MRILLIDDEQDVVELLQDMLEAKGHQLDIAYDGKQGLDLIVLNPYDLIFVDVNLPEISGVELIKYMRAHNIETTTIVVSGYEVMEDFFAKSLGVNEYLRKPFTLSDLEAILRKYANKDKDIPLKKDRGRSR